MSLIREIKRPAEKASLASVASGVPHPQGRGMADLNLVSGLKAELKAELKAKERSREYLRNLFKDDPFDWSLKLDVQALEAEIQDLKKAVCITEMQQCG
jgi:hypothetical protein